MDNDATLVTEIAARITSTKEELRAVEALLATLPEKKERVLGGPSFDDAALSALEEEESSLIRKRDYLSKRIPLLEKQQEQAAATAAQARIDALVGESTARRSEYDHARAAFDQAAEALNAAGEALVGAYHSMLALHDEQAYLVERYREVDVHPVALTDIGERMPDDEAVAGVILKPLTLFWQRQGSIGSSNPWQRKLHELENTRRGEQQPRIDIPGHLRRTIA